MFNNIQLQNFFQRIFKVIISLQLHILLWKIDSAKKMSFINHIFNHFKQFVNYLLCYNIAHYVTFSSYIQGPIILAWYTIMMDQFWNSVHIEYNLYIQYLKCKQSKKTMFYNSKELIFTKIWVLVSQKWVKLKCSLLGFSPNEKFENFKFCKSYKIEMSELEIVSNLNFYSLKLSQTKIFTNLVFFSSSENWTSWIGNLYKLKLSLFRNVLNQNLHIKNLKIEFVKLKICSKLEILSNRKFCQIEKRSAYICSTVLICLSYYYAIGQFRVLSACYFSMHRVLMTQDAAK